MRLAALSTLCMSVQAHETTGDKPLRVYVRASDGTCYHLYGTHRIANVDLFLYERVGPTSVEVWSRARPIDFGEPITVEEWSAALTAFSAYRRKLEALAERDRDAAKFGIPCGKTTIVRCTRTRWVDSDGRQWIRTAGYSNGREVGGGIYRTCLPDEVLAELHAAARGRDKVDFVAERKAAAQAEP